MWQCPAEVAAPANCNPMPSACLARKLRSLPFELCNKRTLKTIHQWWRHGRERSRSGSHSRLHGTGLIFSDMVGWVLLGWMADEA